MSDLEQICREHGWKPDDLAKRGMALQYWVADLFCRADGGIETDAQSAVLTTNDLGADVVLEDTTRQHLRIIQCKASSLGKATKVTPVDETEVNDFFNRHVLFIDRKWVREHGSEEAFNLLGEYGDQIKSGWTVELIFVTTAPSTERTERTARIRTEQYQKDEVSVSCKLLALSNLKDFYNTTLSQTEQMADAVTIDLPEGSYIEKTDPHKTLLAIVKGNTLRNLYKTYKETLFTHNIRDFLGKARQINKAMIHTAEGAPEDFFYFNNGVSAVCSDFVVKNSKLKAEHFQIINGAQTVGALFGAEDNADIYVLFRLTKSDNAKLNEQIIKFNNTQNVINSADWRANDRIQQWLDAEFKQTKARGPLPLLRYVPKRTYRRPKGAIVLSLEDVAKIRYSFLYDPNLIYALPKQLWTYQSEGGHYEKAFGVGEELVDMWPPDEFNRLLLAIAFYLRITEEATKEMKEDDKLWYLKRLRYHLLALAGLLIRGSQVPIDEVGAISKLELFNQLWASFWPNARQSVILMYEAARDAEMTLSAFARSPKKWDDLGRVFSRILKLKPPAIP